MTLTPNERAMALHLRRVFGGAPDGLVELACTDPGGAAPEHARLFDIEALDAAARHAAARNAEQRNVYIGASLRRPDAPRNKRARKSDFYTAPAVWVDLDDGDAAEAAEERWAAEEPTIVVLTGRHPHLRLHAYWRMLAPLTTAADVKDACQRVGGALGGDPAVAHEGALMRLGGSVAWPVKTGRVPELTEVYGPPDLCPIPVPKHAFDVAYPAPAKPAATPAPAPKPLPTAPRARSRYAEQALRNGLNRIAQAGEGQRNNILNAETFSLWRLVLEGALPADVVESAIQQAAAHAGLGENEIAATIASAKTAREGENAA